MRPDPGGSEPRRWLGLRRRTSATATSPSTPWGRAARFAQESAHGRRGRSAGGCGEPGRRLGLRRRHVARHGPQYTVGPGGALQPKTPATGGRGARHRSESRSAQGTRCRPASSSARRRLAHLRLPVQESGPVRGLRRARTEALTTSEDTTVVLGERIVLVATVVGLADAQCTERRRSRTFPRRDAAGPTALKFPTSRCTWLYHGLSVAASCARFPQNRPSSGHDSGHATPAGPPSPRRRRGTAGRRRPPPAGGGRTASSS